MTNRRNIICSVNLARALVLCLVQSALVMSASFAGEIFGTIKADGKIVPKGLKLEIASPAKTYNTETDNYGSYRLYVPEKGKCMLTLYYRKRSPSIQIYSYPKSTRYDFTVEQKDTLYVLKRK